MIMYYEIQEKSFADRTNSCFLYIDDWLLSLKALSINHLWKHFRFEKESDMYLFIVTASMCLCLLDVWHAVQNKFAW